MPESDLVHTLEKIAEKAGHTISIAEMTERGKSALGPNLIVYRPVCTCGWTLSRMASGQVELGWRYGKHNAEAAGAKHIMDIAFKINKENK